MPTTRLSPFRSSLGVVALSLGMLGLTAAVGSLQGCASDRESQQDDPPLGDESVLHEDEVPPAADNDAVRPVDEEDEEVAPMPAIEEGGDIEPPNDDTSARLDRSGLQEGRRLEAIHLLPTAAPDDAPVTAPTAGPGVPVVAEAKAGTAGRGKVESVIVVHDAALAATSELAATVGYAARGTIRFEERPEGVMVTADVRGLTPGVHAFHVHEQGDCSARDAKSAGPHFNFDGSLEGRDGTAKDVGRITGNLGELIADDAGIAVAQAWVPRADLDGPDSIVGRAVVIHAKPNHEDEAPSGGADARVACGVIGLDTPS